MAGVGLQSASNDTCAAAKNLDMCHGHMACFKQGCARPGHSDVNTVMLKMLSDLHAGCRLLATAQRGFCICIAGSPRRASQGSFKGLSLGSRRFIVALKVDCSAFKQCCGVRSWPAWTCTTARTRSTSRSPGSACAPTSTSCTGTRGARGALPGSRCDAKATARSAMRGLSVTQCARCKQALRLGAVGPLRQLSHALAPLQIAPSPARLWHSECLPDPAYWTQTTSFLRQSSPETAVRRLVISDIDGTITKSDLLGHVLPRVGWDWCGRNQPHSAHFHSYSIVTHALYFATLFLLQSLRSYFILAAKLVKLLYFCC